MGKHRVNVEFAGNVVVTLTDRELERENKTAEELAHELVQAALRTVKPRLGDNDSDVKTAVRVRGVIVEDEHGRD